uniref:DUF4704 domain-containing protein n=1 Tax=Schistocephalus solidus TaxID=70667 RepID=A0A183T824_SCHSO
LPELPVEGRETELEPSSIHLIGRLSPHLSSLKALLLAPPQNSSEVSLLLLLLPEISRLGAISVKQVAVHTRRNSPSSTSPSLGSLRIHIIRFLCYLLESGSPSVTKEFAHLGLLGVIMELFFEHKWHTFLHASFEYLVRLIVNRASTLTTDDYSRSDFHNAASNGPSDDCRSQSPEPRRKASNYPTPSSENSNDSLCNGHSDVESPMEAGAILCEPFPRLLHQGCARLDCAYAVFPPYLARFSTPDPVLIVNEG